MSSVTDDDNCLQNDKVTCRNHKDKDNVICVAILSGSKFDFAFDDIDR